MFVHSHTQVGLPLSEVERRLDAVRSDLTTMADVAYRQGERLRARVGPTHGGFAKEVTLHLGMPEVLSVGVVYPLHWKAHGGAILFPELNADLALGHIGPDLTELTLQGIYKPPMGAVGRVVDRALLSRVADATVRDWLERLAAALGEHQISSKEDESRPSSPPRGRI